MSCRYLFVWLATEILNSGWATAQPMPDFNPEVILSNIRENLSKQKAPEIPSARPVGEIFPEQFLKTIAPCDLYDFSGQGTFYAVFSKSQTPRITTSDLESLAKELKWRLRFNRLYASGIARDAFRENVIRLVQSMRSSGINSLNVEQLSYLAELRLEELKRNGTVGECYEIQSIHRPRMITTWKEMVAVSAKNQAKIDRLFQLPLKGQRPSLTQREMELLQGGSLTREEIGELRAIRKATEVFENATYLKNDYAGGLVNNARSELFGGKQLVCTDEAETYFNFLKVLLRRGLLRHFAPDGKIDRPDRLLGGHQATSLYHKRTGQIYVLDSWHEPGGTAAHITRREDWLNYKDSEDVVAVIEE